MRPYPTSRPPRRLDPALLLLAGLLPGLAPAALRADEPPAEPVTAPPADPDGTDDPAPGAEPAPADPDAISRFYLPPLPYYQETTATRGLRLFFPFYFEQWDDRAAEHSLGILPFYWRWRGPDELHETDVVLGLYWRFRRPDRFTDVAGPLYVSRTPDGYDVGLPPLFLVGGDAESNYQILALWFWRFASDESVFTLAPPFYYYADAQVTRYGIPPILFGGRTGTRGYSVFFPVFWHFYDDADESGTTVIPPLFVDIDAEGDWTAGIAPILFFGGGEDSAHATVFPLFHYGTSPEATRFISPLAWYADTGEGEGWGSLLYHQWDEGSEWFRTVAPFWFGWGDDRTGERNDLGLLLYHHTDPISSDWVLFPFWWDFHDYGKNRAYGLLPFFFHDESLFENRSTTWVLPTFQYSEWPRTGAEEAGWAFNMHPLVYVGTEGEDHHQVVFPVWWWFSDPRERATVFFPLYWDFEDPESRFWTFFPLVWHYADREGDTTVVVNTIYTTDEHDDGSEGWHFHFVPLFDVGRDRPEDLSWSVLYGLVGYDRRGEYERLRLFWLPIDL